MNDDDDLDTCFPVDPDREDNNAKSAGRVIAAGPNFANPGLMVTASEAEKRYGIPATRIHRWKARNMIPVRGYRGRVPVYAPPELRNLNRLADLDVRSKSAA